MLWDFWSTAAGQIVGRIHRHMGAASFAAQPRFETGSRRMGRRGRPAKVASRRSLGATTFMFRLHARGRIEP